MFYYVYTLFEQNSPKWRDSGMSAKSARCTLIMGRDFCNPADWLDIIQK